MIKPRKGNWTYDDFMKFQKYVIENNVKLQQWVDTLDDLGEGEDNYDCKYVVETWLFYVWIDSQWLIIPNLTQVKEIENVPTEDVLPWEILVTKDGWVQMYAPSWRTTLKAIESPR